MDVGKLCVVVCLFTVLTLPSFATVTITSRGNGGTVASPAHFVAKGTSSCSKGIAAMGIYTSPYVLAHVASGSTLDTNLKMTPGTHNAVVHECDNCGQSSKMAITINVVVAPSSGSVPHSNHVRIITETN